MHALTAAAAGQAAVTHLALIQRIYWRWCQRAAKFGVGQLSAQLALFAAPPGPQLALRDNCGGGELLNTGEHRLSGLAGLHSQSHAVPHAAPHPPPITSDVMAKLL